MSDKNKVDNFKLAIGNKLTNNIWYDPFMKSEICPVNGSKLFTFEMCSRSGHSD